MTGLLADWALYVVFVLVGGMMVAGVFGAAGLAWLGAWLLAWRRRRMNPRPDDPR